MNSGIRLLNKAGTAWTYVGLDRDKRKFILRTPDGDQIMHVDRFECHYGVQAVYCFRYKGKKYREFCKEMHNHLPVIVLSQLDLPIEEDK